MLRSPFITVLCGSVINSFTVSIFLLPLKCVLHKRMLSPFRCFRHIKTHSIKWATNILEHFLFKQILQHFFFYRKLLKLKSESMWWHFGISQNRMALMNYTLRCIKLPMSLTLWQQHILHSFVMDFLVACLLFSRL